eukprot:914167-Prymnesium_polylepis.1
MRYCTCPRSDKTKRHKVPASMQCAMIIDSIGEDDPDGESLGVSSLSASRMSERESQIHEARAAARDAIRISSLKPMRGGGSPIEAAPVLAKAVVTAVPLPAAPAPPPPEPLAAPVDTSSEAAEAELPSAAPPEPRAKP